MKDDMNRRPKRAPPVLPAISESQRAVIQLASMEIRLRAARDGLELAKAASAGQGANSRRTRAFKVQQRNVEDLAAEVARMKEALHELSSEEDAIGEEDADGEEDANGEKDKIAVDGPSSLSSTGL